MRGLPAWAQLEVVRETCPTLYREQETHLQVNAHLRSLGFVNKGWRWHGHLRCEGTGFFIRRAKWTDGAVQPDCEGCVYG